MEATVMGRVVTEAIIENLHDLVAVEMGILEDDRVRRVSVADAWVDTGATMLSLPKRLIEQLGLTQKSVRRVTTSQGTSETGLYSTVRLTVQGRECPVDGLAVPDGVPVLIGQIPLECMDFVVDPQNRRLIGNPAHGGEQMYELY